MCHLERATEIGSKESINDPKRAILLSLVIFLSAEKKKTTNKELITATGILTAI